MCTRWNSHFHLIVLEGGFDSDGNFHYLPIQCLDKLTEFFRKKVINFFVEKKLLNQDFANNMLSWKHSGFSIDNSVRLYVYNNKAKENLSQYIARAPVSLKKILYVKEKNSVIYKTTYNNYFKENIKIFNVYDSIALLTQHLPHKGQHLIRYYGIYSSRTKGVRNKKEDDVKVEEIVQDDPTDTISRKASRRAWAALIQKIYDIDPMVCPEYGGEMKVVAIIRDFESIKKIKKWVSKQNHSPPLEETARNAS